MKTQKTVLAKYSVQWMVRLAILIAITIGFQMFKLPQLITGPVVNLMLFLSCILLGLWGGIVLGLITPLIALLAGIMPRAEVVPVIMVANAVLVISFYVLRAKQKQFYRTLLGILVGSLLKYYVFAIAVAFILNLPPPAAQMLGVPQLFTALSGGALSVMVEKALSKTDLLKQ